MSDYKPGDRVVLEHGDGSRLVTEVGTGKTPGFTLAGFGWCAYETFERDGWRVVEHAPKSEPLPTEPNTAWHTAQGDVVVVDDEGFICFIYGLTEVDASVHGPLTRLVPEGSERERVVAQIVTAVRQNCTPPNEAYSLGGDHLIAAVADWIENPPDWVNAPWRSQKEVSDV